MTTAPTDEPSTVLIVEDDSDIRALLRRRIERIGLPVIEVTTAEAALDTIGTTRPALVMLDIRLPGRDGWWFLERLRADATTADVPVLVVSIVDDPGESIRPRVDGYLMKPFRGAQVDRLLNELLPIPKD